MKKKIKNLFITVTMALISIAAFASVSSEIKNATKAGKSVFLVVTDAGVSETENAVSIANQAQKIAPKSVVIKMNRSDAANKELVEEYKLSGTSLPVILVIAFNGIVSGGYLSNQATAEKLVALIPTTKKAEVLKAINNGKSVFVVVSKKSMKENKEVMTQCETACTEMRKNAKVISLDLDDHNEKSFLSELKVDKNITQPQTYVINAQGQIAGTLNGIVDSKTLVATATKKPAGGCCSPGSGKSCGPKK